jgi:methylmalonyl-CoA mutase cobalamin-binding domain/chain
MAEAKPKLQALTESLIEMEEAQAIEQVETLLASGESAENVLAALSEGMSIVGDRYSREEYFLADLVFAAEIFKQSMNILEPVLAKESGGERPCLGRVVVGTVEGDLHDIGKNIFVALARNAGFSVNDLGIDVSPAAFIEHATRDQAHIIGMSGILTMSVAPMIQTVEALTEAGMRDKVKVILGGLPVDDRWQTTVGSDAYTDNAYKGVEMCIAFMEGA